MNNITMNKKEREQFIVFNKLKEEKITQTEAALQLGITTRWVRKKMKRFVEDGDAGLVHKNRGRPSGKSWCKKEKKLALNLLRFEWRGFGPTFAAEKLKEEENITINKETLRQEMIKEKIWQAKKKKIKHRKRRDRREIIGVMVQLDGSPHDWFEGRAPWCTLLVFIDDATSEVLWLEFVKSESVIDVMKATKNYILLHGIPHEFYVDFGSVFSVNLNNQERIKKTQWERAVEELLVKVNHAYSPQAKGRVERVNRTLQDRLVKEMRLAKISSIEDANKFLQESDFIAKHNKRFAVPPAKKGNAHRPANCYNLENIFCIKEKRILNNDYTVSYKKRVFQLEKQQRTIVRPKDIIIIKTHLDNSIKLSIRKTNLAFKEVNVRPQKAQQEEKVKIYKPRKPNINSRRWASGLSPISGENFLVRRVE